MVYEIIAISGAYCNVNFNRSIENVSIVKLIIIKFPVKARVKSTIVSVFV